MDDVDSFVAWIVDGQMSCKETLRGNLCISIFNTTVWFDPVNDLCVFLIVDYVI